MSDSLRTDFGYMLDRAMADEAEVKRLREGIEAMLDQPHQRAYASDGTVYEYVNTDRLRELLDGGDGDE